MEEDIKKEDLEFHVRETVKHRTLVGTFMADIIDQLEERAMTHDNSKLGSPELEGFAKVVKGLAELEYGSEEYKAKLREIQPAVQEHYCKNSHHPEHFKNGLMEMDLLDVIEMLADWKAATKRHKTGDIIKSLEINAKRFNIEPMLLAVLVNTVRNLGWDKE